MTVDATAIVTSAVRARTGTAFSNEYMVSAILAELAHRFQSYMPPGVYWDGTSAFLSSAAIPVSSPHQGHIDEGS